MINTFFAFGAAVIACALIALHFMPVHCADATVTLFDVQATSHVCLSDADIDRFKQAFPGLN